MTKTWHELSARVGRNDLPYTMIMAVINDELDREDLPKAIEDAWTSAEWPVRAANQEVWVSMFDRALDSDQYLLEDEVRPSEELPEFVTLYRGAAKGYEKGMSWTDSFDRAHWFATRLNALREHGVYKVTVPREMVLARFNDSRHENEWVLNAPEFMDEDVELVPEDQYQSLLFPEGSE